MTDDKTCHVCGCDLYGRENHYCSCCSPPQEKSTMTTEEKLEVTERVRKELGARVRELEVELKRAQERALGERFAEWRRKRGPATKNNRGSK